MGPPSSQQVSALEKLGILPDAIDNAGKASLILDRLQKEKKLGWQHLSKSDYWNNVDLRMSVHGPLMVQVK